MKVAIPANRGIILPETGLKGRDSSAMTIGFLICRYTRRPASRAAAVAEFFP
jgi:hypothetical protein